jgi:hypothetical protein
MTGIPGPSQFFSPQAASQTAPIGTTSTGSSMDGLADTALWLGITGGLWQAIGAHRSAQAQKDMLRGDALNAEFAASQSSVEARALERDAVNVLNASQSEIALRGLIEAQDVGGFRAGTAASGIDVGIGNAAETERALRVAAEVDKRRIRTRGEQEAQRLRNAAANTRASGVLARASAENMRRSARTINPTLGAIGAGLNAAGPLLGQYATYQARR